MKDSALKKQKELAKWKRELTKKPYRGYGVMLIVMVALVHLLDEYASSSSGAIQSSVINDCLLYTSDAADDLLGVDLGGRRNI